VDEPRTLTPTQERLLAQLRREPTPLVFDARFVDALVARAREGFEELSARLGGERLYVSKSMLTRVHGCEAQYLAPSDFAWSPSTARGFISHKAIELHTNWRGEATPAQLVEEAIARLVDEPSNRGDFIAGLTEGDLAELRGFAVERLTNFLHDFPPLDPRANPMLEASMKWRATACIELAGKTDLVLGKPDGRISKRLIIDFKTGNRSFHHRADLQFYALLETLIRAVPPRKLVTYYLDYAEAEVEDVTEAMLEAALDRTLEAVARHVELAVEARKPVKRPGASCRWCPLQATCDEGRAHLAMLDDDGRQGFDDAEVVGA